MQLQFNKIFLLIFIFSLFFTVSCSVKHEAVKSDNEYYRADAIANSLKRETSKEKALFMAKQKLVKLIQDEDSNSSKISQYLSNIKIISEDTKVIRKGRFQSYIAIEVPKNNFKK